jgi:hypothetical protein
MSADKTGLTCERIINHDPTIHHRALSTSTEMPRSTIKRPQHRHELMKRPRGDDPGWAITGPLRVEKLIKSDWRIS